MSASSPRCIQQTILPDSSLIDHVKPLDASPVSTTSAPSSYNSELHNPSTDFQFNHSNLPSQLHHHLSIQLTQPATKSFILNHHSHSHSHPHPHPHSSSPPPQQQHQQLCTKSSHPSCISALLSTKFYGPCPNHSNLRKNDLNLFCTTHAAKICQYCHQSNHSDNRICKILHVSRYMYHDVLLAKEAASLLDVSDVQSYLNNGNRVVYIDRRAQPKSKLAPHAKACAVCSRTLQDPYRFCSVFCRLAHANDPAAVSSLPVPDACPLLQQNTRKKTQPSSPSPSHSKRNDRSLKRVDRFRSPTMSPVTPTRPSLKALSRMAPALQLTISKKSRRKGTPVRSPSLYDGNVHLCHGTCF